MDTSLQYSATTDATPPLLDLGPLPTHLLFDALAYFLAFRLYLALRNRRGDVLDRSTRWKVFFAAVVGALLGAKVLALLEHHAVILTSISSPMAFLAAGKSIVGGLLGGWWAVEITKKKLGVKTRTGDLYVFPLILGMAIGRVGCFLQGLSDRTHGIESSLPWAFDFGDGVSRHPTQLYEILFLILLGCLLILIRSKSWPEGRLFRIFLGAYLGWRLLVDFLKPADPILGLTTIQWACLLGLLTLALGLPRGSVAVPAKEPIPAQDKAQVAE